MFISHSTNKPSDIIFHGSYVNTYCIHSIRIIKITIVWMWQLIVLYTDRNVLLEHADSTFRIYKKRKSSSPKRLGTTGYCVIPGKIAVMMLSFSMWHFKCQFSAVTTALFKFQCQVSAVTRALFNLNAHCLTPLFFFEGGD